MNKIDRNHQQLAAMSTGSGRPVPGGLEIEFDRIVLDFVATIRRQARLVLSIMLATMLVSLIYLALRPSEYRGTMSILIDPARANVLQNQQAIALPVVDSGFVDSQVEILKSDATALGVVRKLKLTEDPDFNRVTAIRALLSPVLQLLLGVPPSSSLELERNAVAKFQRQLTVSRAGVSYIIEIAFSALDPDKAALITNTISDVYLDQQISSRFDATRRASKWLQDRSEELRARVMKSEETVQNYKTVHGLVEAGGRLLIEQQISELSAQITTLQAQTSEAQVRYTQVGQLIQSGDFDSGAIDLGSEGVIGRLRVQASDLSRREKELEQRFGPTHRLVLDARSEQRSVRRQLEEEIRRLHESLRTTQEIAQQKQVAAQASLQQLTAQFAGVREKEIFLRELQRELASNKQLFETFANRYKEMLQQESMPMTDSRVVAPATRPIKPSNPRLSLVLAGALVFGLLGGIAVALLRDRIDDTVRRVSDVEDRMGRPVLALLEDLPTKNSDSASKRAAFAVGADTHADDRRVLPYSIGILRHVIQHPLSQFAEAFRSLRVSLTLRGPARTPSIIGITSTQPAEGKTTIACNFAQYLTQTGSRVLLIDGDLRNPSLSRKLCPTDNRGLPDILAGRSRWQDLILHDPTTDMLFLPGYSTSDHSRSAEMLATDDFAALLRTLSAEFDVIVIDLAPVGGTFDARAIAPLIDTFLYVVSWGHVERKHLERALHDAPEVYEKISGFILNRIDPVKFSLFDNVQRPDYGYRYSYGSGQGSGRV